MWLDLEKGFQAAFEAAWTTYKMGNVPIGAAVVNESGNIVAVGINQIKIADNGPLSRHQLAHAEANAILQLSEVTEPNLHPDIRKYTIYSVMEPCPFCFGAIVMGSIRHVKYAARDGWAGAVALNQTIDYIKRKKITVEGPFSELEFVHIAMQTCFEAEQSKNSKNFLFEQWSQYSPDGVELGQMLAEKKILDEYVQKSTPFSEIYNDLLKFIS